MAATFGVMIFLLRIGEGFVLLEGFTPYTNRPSPTSFARNDGIEDILGNDGAVLVIFSLIVSMLRC